MTLRIVANRDLHASVDEGFFNPWPTAPSQDQSADIT